MTVELRPIDPAEFPTFYRTMVETFGGEPHDDERELDRGVFEYERSLAGFDDTDLVSTTSLFSRELSVPGGTTPVAAVTMVTVSPTHRRQGVLTAMMRRQLTDVYEGGRESVAALWASEATIYGRFGYGLATHQGSVSGETRAVGVPALTPGRVRQVAVEEARPTMVAIHESVRTRNVGWLDRPGRWWDCQVFDPDRNRNGASPLRCVTYEDAGGTATGYALYRIKSDWNETGPTNEVRIVELTAGDAGAHAGLWRFLLSLDLVRTFRNGRIGVDDPIRHIVPNARAIALQVSDGLWVRLTDVGRALAARRYASDVDLVLEVRDEFLPWNARRWRLSGGPKGATCTPTSDSPELSLSSTELGAAYLGGTSLATLAAAGRVSEQRPGALDQASLAFAAQRAPWCPDGF